MGLAEIRAGKENRGKPKEKKVYHIPKKSKKRIALEKEIGLTDSQRMDKWFEERRKNLVGVCQCGCSMPSQKKDDTFYRHCICHIFPKFKFKSIDTHPLNFVERRFWGGCHGIMDDTSIERWVGMADWDDIKAKFLVLEQSLTDKEKTFKFYHKLKELVDNN